MPIDALTVFPSSLRPTVFAAEMDQHIAELQTFQTQMNAAIAALNALSSGTAVGIPYTFSTTTADADPGAGALRLDNATQNLATTIRADLAGSDGTTYTDVLATLDDSTSAVKGHIMLQKLADPTKWILFTISALASPAGYKNITVAVVGASAASPFADGDSIVMKFSRTGDKGEAGAAGAVWRNGAGVPDNGVGADGDYYLRTSNGDVYLRSAGTYSVVANIKGAAGATGALILLATASASSSAAVDFTSSIDSTYDEYELHLHAVLPETTNQNLWLRASKDSGSTFLAGTEYSYSQQYIDGTNTFQIGYSSGASMMLLTPEVVPNAGTISGAGVSGVIRFFRPSQGGYVNFVADLCYRKDSDTLTRPVMVGQVTIGAGALNAIRFLFAAGNILSGEFKLYGIQKA